MLHRPSRASDKSERPPASNTFPIRKAGSPARAWTMRGYKDGGAFFQTFAFTEMLKCRVCNAEKADFHFHRDSRTREETTFSCTAAARFIPSKSRRAHIPARTPSRTSRRSRAFRSRSYRCGHRHDGAPFRLARRLHGARRRAPLRTAPQRGQALLIASPISALITSHERSGRGLPPMR